MKTLVKVSLHVLALAGCVMSLNGCSKAKDETGARPAAALEPTPPPQTQPQPTAMTPPASSGPARLENVNAALQKQDYEAAVDILIQAKTSSQYTNADQIALYTQQRRATAEALANAMSTDPRAKAAYERLGRAATGR